jgi:Ala-tRNA(Pro) deacylase
VTIWSRRIIMVSKVKEYLDNNAVKYEALQHPTAFTAQEVAASADIPGKEMAKSVIVRLGGRIAMAVLPASEIIDFERLKETAAVDEAELAFEEEYDDLFPECEHGAIPPFGNLYGMPVYVAKSLVDEPVVLFAAGSLKELVKITTADFRRLVSAKISSFSYKQHGETRWKRPTHA